MDQGLKYFGIECNFFNNREIELISSKLGIISENVILRLYSHIYKHKGYYMSCTDEDIVLFAKHNHITVDLLKSIIAEALVYNIFSYEKYEKYNILTSEYIQDHFLHATKSKRIITLKKNYLCLTNYIILQIEKEKYWENIKRSIILE